MITVRSILAAQLKSWPVYLAVSRQLVMSQSFMISTVYFVENVEATDTCLPYYDDLPNVWAFDNHLRHGAMRRDGKVSIGYWQRIEIHSTGPVLDVLRLSGIESDIKVHQGI